MVLFSCLQALALEWNMAGAVWIPLRDLMNGKTTEKTCGSLLTPEVLRKCSASCTPPGPGSCEFLSRARKWCAHWRDCGVTRSPSNNPCDTSRRAGTTYLHSWVTLLPGFSFLSLWAQNNMAWVPALGGSWERDTLKSVTNLTSTRLGLDISKDHLGGCRGSWPEGRRPGQGTCDHWLPESEVLARTSERLIFCMDPAGQRP